MLKQYLRTLVPALVCGCLVTLPNSAAEAFNLRRGGLRLLRQCERRRQLRTGDAARLLPCLQLRCNRAIRRQPVIRGIVRVPAGHTDAGNRLSTAGWLLGESGNDADCTTDTRCHATCACGITSRRSVTARGR